MTIKVNSCYTVNSYDQKKLKINFKQGGGGARPALDPPLDIYNNDTILVCRSVTVQNLFCKTNRFFFRL